MSSKPNPTTRFQLLSWNLLNNYAVPKHAPQADRLSAHIDHVNAALLAATPVVLYVCEGTRVEHLLRLAQACGLSVVGTPSPYTDGDWMMFAVSPELLPHAKASFVPFSHQANKFGVLSLQLGPHTIVGAHYPWRPLLDTLARNRATEHVLDHLADRGPSIVLGDLNSLPWMAARKRLSAAGLHEIHQVDRPQFPQPNYKGITFPRLAPDVSIDAMYVSGHYQATDIQHEQSSASDHPLLSAILELTT